MSVRVARSTQLAQGCLAVDKAVVIAPFSRASTFLFIEQKHLEVHHDSQVVAQSIFTAT